ncbi:hypothetical protein [Pseudomonas sp. IT-P294]|uniref:hypothetical protein n=1 Tax=Pseudomonas sp. IT-P294 TaxID=3026454 RepID=UPI0039DF32FD
MSKTQKIDIQILAEGDELVSTICQHESITLTVKKSDNTYKVFLVEKNDQGLFKIKTDHEILVSKVQSTPLVKTCKGSGDSLGDEKTVRAYTL